MPSIILLSLCETRRNKVRTIFSQGLSKACFLPDAHHNLRESCPERKRRSVRLRWLKLRSEDLNKLGCADGGKGILGRLLCIAGEKYMKRGR